MVGVLNKLSHCNFCILYKSFVSSIFKRDLKHFMPLRFFCFVLLFTSFAYRCFS